GCLRPTTEENDLHGIQEDVDVEPDRKVFDVVKVVLHLLDFFLEIVGIPIADLCPSCDAREDGQAEEVVRNLLTEEFKVGDRMWPGTDEVHVPADDVDELRKLVEAELPQPFTHSGDAVGIVANPLGLLRGDSHGAKFEELERSPMETDTVLDEEYGAS